MTRRFQSRRLLLVGSVAATLTLAAAVPAAAGGHDPGSGGGMTVVASGLDNPRQLSFGPNGDLYVAEAGKGGAGPCMVGGEGNMVCLGATGAVTRITAKGVQSRVVTGLPSFGAQGDAETAPGSSAIGPSDVTVIGGHKLAVLIGLGADPAVRATLPPNASRLGTLIAADWKSGRSHQIADFAGYEETQNPIHNPDSDPVGLLAVCGSYVVADAGGNDVVRLGSRGHLSTLAVLPDQLADAPPFLGLPPGAQIPAQSVPTSVAVGPDGAYYVSQLTGFPFQKGLANIYRIGRNGALTIYASGLTNVTDLAFAGRSLYAVQISTEGLLTGPIGSLIKVNPGGTSSVIAGGLFAPYGIAIKGNAAYITTGSVAPGAGQVVRIPLT